MKHLIKSILLFFIIVATASYSAISYSQNKSLKLIAPDSTQGSAKSDNNQFLQDIVKRVKKDYVEEKNEDWLKKYKIKRLDKNKIL